MQEGMQLSLSTFQNASNWQPLPHIGQEHPQHTEKSQKAGKQIGVLGLIILLQP